MKVFQQSQEILRVLLVTTFVRDTRLKAFDNALEIIRGLGALVATLA